MVTKGQTHGKKDPPNFWGIRQNLTGPEFFGAWFRNKDPKGNKGWFGSFLLDLV